MLNKLRRKIIRRFFRHMETYDITIQELKNKQNKGALVIDVRSSQEYNEGHISGAINIPEYEINSEINKILKDKEREIVLYCTIGIRSKNAYNKLIKLGYKNVYNLYGGLENW